MKIDYRNFVNIFRWYDPEVICGFTSFCWSPDNRAIRSFCLLYSCTYYSPKFYWPCFIFQNLTDDILFAKLRLTLFSSPNFDWRWFFINIIQNNMVGNVNKNITGGFQNLRFQYFLLIQYPIIVFRIRKKNIRLYPKSLNRNKK